MINLFKFKNTLILFACVQLSLQAQTDICNLFYNVIIVGGGTAGMVLANRLTEDPNVSVLVLDGGRDDTRLPQLLPDDAPFPIPNKETNQWGGLSRGALSTFGDLVRRGFIAWEHVPLLRDDPNSRSVWYPRGASWGGSSTNNFTIALRGSPFIYDQWDLLTGGLGIWNYDTVLAYFKKYENRTQLDAFGNPYFNPALPIGTLGSFNASIHGASGPIYLAWAPFEDPVALALYASTQLTLGLPTRVDFDYPPTEFGLTVQPSTVLDQFGVDFGNLNPYPTLYTFPNTPDYQAVGLAGAPVAFQRVTSANAYIYPIEERPNLTIISEALVTKILFDDQKRAIGVEYLPGWNIFSTGRNIATNDAGLGGTPNDARFNAHVAKETVGFKVARASQQVILSAGTYNSPHLLMLSGIGPSATLQSFGIPVISDLPGVGQNLQDHPEVFVTWRFKQFYNPFLYVLNGINSSFLTVMTLNFSPTNKPYPDFHAHIYPGGIAGVADLAWAPNGGWPRLDPSFTGCRCSGIGGYPIDMPTTPIFTVPGNTPVFGPPQYIYPTSQRADPPISIFFHASMLVEQLADIESRGFVTLRSADPTEHPKIVTNYLLAQSDIDAHIAAFRDVIQPFVEALRDNPATHFFQPNPAGPPFISLPGGLGYFDDWVQPTRAQFETAGVFDPVKYTQFLLDNIWAHHASGTCKMGLESDPMAVVDALLRVFGVERLRVCDCSIFPVIPNANTATPAYMVAERLADLLKAELPTIEPIESINPFVDSLVTIFG